MSLKDRRDLLLPPSQPDLIDQIKRLAELRDQGIVSAEEFETKKKDLLGL